MDPTQQYSSGGGPQFIDSSFHGPVTFGNGQPARYPTTLPRAINRLFTGREDVIKRIADAFSLYTASDVRREVPRRFVVCGLGGTGKSELCLKYAIEYRQSYWGVFWIDCKNQNTALNGFKDIGRLCAIEEPGIASVKQMLSSEDRRFLLVIDNADDFEYNYSQYFPSGGRGDIIITTRNPHLRSKYATVGSEDLPQLELSLARELLIRSAGIPDSDRAAQFASATEIVQELGRHTLALVHAGAYIEYFRQMSMSDYLKLYRAQRSILFENRRNQEDSDYETVHLTFEISIQKLESLKSKGNTNARDAIELITLLAFFHNEGEIEKIMETAVEYATTLEERQSSDMNLENADPLDMDSALPLDLPEYLPSTKMDSNRRLKWLRACKMLENLSLITLQQKEGRNVLNMHVLVHRWAFERHSMVYANSPKQLLGVQSKIWLQACLILALACMGNLEYHPIFEILRTHVGACLNHSIRSYTEELREFRVLPVLHQLAWLQFRMADYTDLIVLVDIVQAEILRRSDIRSVVRQRTELELYFFRGIVLSGQKEILLAVKELKLVVDQCERMRAVGDSLRINSQRALAIAYRDNGQIQMAIELLEHILQVRQKMPDDDPTKLDMQHDLASAYIQEGQVKKAIELLEYVVSIEENISREDHPNRLVCQNNLAIAYLKDGQVKVATRLFEHVVRVEEKILREDPPNRLGSEFWLARAYFEGGQTEAAARIRDHINQVKSASKTRGTTEIKIVEEPSKISVIDKPAGLPRKRLNSTQRHSSDYSPDRRNDSKRVRKLSGSADVSPCST